MRNNAQRITNYYMLLAFLPIVYIIKDIYNSIKQYEVERNLVLKKFFRMLLLLLILIIPLTSYFAADNLITRMPDLYTYEFTAREVSDAMELSHTDKELGQLFAGYMTGQSDELVILNYTTEEETILTRAEQQSLAYFKNLLDKILIAAGTCLLGMLLIYFILLNQDWKEEIRSAYKWSFLVYLIFGAATFGLYYIPITRDLFLETLFLHPWPADGVLSTLIDHQFILHWLLLRTGIALVIMIVMGLITWRITKTRRMFEHRMVTSYW